MINWTMTWDGENRLVQMQSLSGAPVGLSNRLTFVYDQQGRRVSKTTESFVAGAWSITLSNRFIYDGWNLLAEINATNNAVINSYVWGLDLSGSWQGAGGIGGLLARGEFTTLDGQSSTAFYHCDNVGNITSMVDTNQQVVARYLYEPFGGLLAMTGPSAEANSYRFSSKEAHEQSGLIYYLYRFYEPQLQRWINRDPIEETGGPNLHQFVLNKVTDAIDPFGKQTQPTQQPGITYPPAFPSKPFEAPPAGTGGTSGGNLAPAYPLTPYDDCEKEDENTVRRIRYYDDEPCPCANTRKNCIYYERCKYIGTAGTRGTVYHLKWVPQTSCSKCPENKNYPPTLP